MTIALGTVRPGSTILIPFNTFDSNDPSASVIVSAFVLADIGIYKGTSMDERGSTTGVVLLDTDGINIDAAVGIHGFTIDLSSNATDDFYTAGSRYYVTVGPITVDAATVNFLAATFEIGYPGAILDGQIATLASQTSFTITNAPTDDSALVGCTVIIHDQASATQFAVGYVSAYTTAADTITLAADPGIFTMAAGDNVSFFMPANVQAVAGTTQTAGDIPARLPTALVSGRMSSDLVAVSGDTVAADNLELQYDTTGLAGDTFPSTQSQLAGITNTGSAVNRTAASYVLTTGTQSSGTISSVAALDGTNHEHTDTTGEMELYYEFLIGAGLPSSVTVTGYLNGNNDDLEIHGFDWVASAFVRIGTLNGKNAATNEVNSFDLFTDMVGTGSDFGKVRVQFIDGAFTLTSATLAVDQIFVSFSQQGGGYDNGAVWLDTTASNTNTVSGVDGISTNPVSTIGAVNTLLANLNLSRVQVAPNSSVTFAAAQENQEFAGLNWNLALGGQSVSNSHFTGADVSGTMTATVEAHFDHCEIDDSTMGAFHMDSCDFAGDVTLSAAATYQIDGCFHSKATAPVIDFGDLVASTTVHIHNYHGALTISELGSTATDVLHFSSPDGKLTLDSTCIGGTVNLNGTFDFVNSGSGMTINEDGRVSKAAVARVINPQVNTAFSNITFEMYDSTNHNPNTGLTVTGERSLDGAAYAGVSGTIAEISDGTYQFDAAAGDMNGALVVLRFSSSGADDTFVHVKTAA